VINFVEKVRYFFSSSQPKPEEGNSAETDSPQRRPAKTYQRKSVNVLQSKFSIGDEQDSEDEV
jgi:hypothetical protein